MFRTVLLTLAFALNLLAASSVEGHAQSLPDRFFLGCMETCDTPATRRDVQGLGIDMRETCVSHCGCLLSHLQRNHNRTELFSIFMAPISQAATRALGAATDHCIPQTEAVMDAARSRHAARWQEEISGFCQTELAVPEGRRMGEAGSGVLGINVSDLEFSENGVRVISVQPDGASYGVLPEGSIILGINNHGIRGVDGLLDRIASMSHGEVAVVCGGQRDNEGDPWREMIVQIELGPRQ